MKPSQQCLDLIKQFEGLRLEAYRDVVGILTIGYGHTGKDFSPGDKITEIQATQYLERDVETCATHINRCVTVKMTQGQFDALCSFAFNLGTGTLDRSSLLSKFNHGDVSGASQEFDRWVHAGGKVLPGLVRRRAVEKAMFLS